MRKTLLILSTAMLAMSLSACQTLGTGTIAPRGETHTVAVTLPQNAPSIGSDYSATHGFKWDVRPDVHSGIDVLAPVGYPVLAAADGKVTNSEYLSEKRTKGIKITVAHSGNLVTQYHHLSASHVEIGQLVKRGDHIANVGTTGLAHLHFTVRRDMQVVNPHVYWLGGVGNIECFNPNIVQEEASCSMLTYPVKCLDQKGGVTEVKKSTDNNVLSSSENSCGERDKIKAFEEHFTNFLARFESANNCLNRNGKDAAGSIRSFFARANIDIDVQKVSLDSYFRLAELARSKDCLELADAQYRAIKIILKKVKIPVYQERLDAALQN